MLCPTAFCRTAFVAERSAGIERLNEMLSKGEVEALSIDKLTFNEVSNNNRYLQNRPGWLRQRFGDQVVSIIVFNSARVSDEEGHRFERLFPEAFVGFHRMPSVRR